MSTYELIKNRRTVRKFSQRAVSSELLKMCIDAARVAPSAMNLQPLKYISVTKREEVAKIFPLVKWAGYLKGAYTPAENELPTAFVAVCVDNSITELPSEFDIGAAVQSLVLTALEEGVASCIMGAIDRPKIKEVLSIPVNWRLAYVIALGYGSECPEETAVTEGDVKYFLKDNVLRVPKRSLEEILTEIN